MIIMDYLDKKMQTSTAPIAAVNAAIPGAFGLKTFQEKHPDHYFDVGIAEQHSITFASALASQEYVQSSSNQVLSCNGHMINYHMI